MFYNQHIIVFGELGYKSFTYWYCIMIKTILFKHLFFNQRLFAGSLQNFTIKIIPMISPSKGISGVYCANCMGIVSDFLSPATWITEQLMYNSTTINTLCILNTFWHLNYPYIYYHFSLMSYPISMVLCHTIYFYSQNFNLKTNLYQIQRNYSHEVYN